MMNCPAVVKGSWYPTCCACGCETTCSGGCACCEEDAAGAVAVSVVGGGAESVTWGTGCGAVCGAGTLAGARMGGAVRFC